MTAFEAMRDGEGRIFEIPLSYGPGTIVYFDADLVADSGLTLDDGIKSISNGDALEFGIKLVDNTERENTYLNMGRDGLGAAYGLIADRMKDYVDVDEKTVNFAGNQDFIDILERTKALGEQGYYDAEDSIDFYNMEYHFAMSEDYGTQAAFYSLAPDSKHYRPVPLTDAYGNVEPYTFPRLAVNSTSKYKELAWEFIKFLLSDEIQTSPNMYGLGVSWKGFDAFLRRELDMYNDGNGSDVGMDDFKGLIMEYMSQINVRPRSDEVISDFIFEELLKFFKDEQTADDTAKALQAKIDNYLYE
jgi:multiple sugar transport system substrate-binding protein